MISFLFFSNALTTPFENLLQPPGGRAPQVELVAFDSNLNDSILYLPIYPLELLQQLSYGAHDFGSYKSNLQLIEGWHYTPFSYFNVNCCP